MALDFDEEGRKLLAAVGLDVEEALARHEYSHLDAVLRIQNSRIFIGNQVSASSLELLQQQSISHVVNCTDSMPNYHEDSAAIAYYRFDVSRFIYSGKLRDSAQLAAFCLPLFCWIDDAVAQGGNVLIHCLAGAHRAGATGIACVMHYGRLDAVQATSLVQRLRPIVSPIGNIPLFLSALEAAMSTDDWPRPTQSPQPIA